MSPLSTKDLHRIFEKLDKNRDGFVSLEELNWLLEKIGVQFSIAELESFVGKTCLDFNEFLFFYKSISENNSDDEDEDEDEDELQDHDDDLMKAFRVFDINGDGFISSEELKDVLMRLGLLDETCSSGIDCTSMIHVFDTNLDGQLDFEEFKSMMLQTVS